MMNTQGRLLAVLAVVVILGAVALLVAAPVPLRGQGPVTNPNRVYLPVIIRTHPQQIVFTSYSDEKAEIYVRNRDGSGLTRLTDTKRLEAEPAWRP